jgi:hypothetical protein
LETAAASTFAPSRQRPIRFWAALRRVPKSWSSAAQF